MYPHVSIIILNWNGWKDTVECLESLYQIDYPNYQVILVDNNSSDNSVEKIKEYCEGKNEVKSDFFQYNPNSKPIKIIEYSEKESESANIPSINDDKLNHNLIIIKNNKNYGFAQGNNVGIKYAMNSIYTDYVLLLNNDTVVDKDFLKELVKTAESQTDIGFVGAKTYLYNDKNRIQAGGGGNVDFKHGVVHEIAFHKIDDGKYDKNLELDYISGACLLCKKEVINKVGSLDSSYFMYWEDVNWCFTGKKYGYKSIYSYKSKIWHKYGSSSPNYFKIYYLNRNRLYFIKEHGKLSQKGSFFIYFFLFRFWVESFDYLIYRRDMEKFKSLIRGVSDGLIKH
ncbi:glycosyltransferase family 2 protein [Methanobacterium sp. ACI-7]|uniref:glycosyltransferase family 2 protein n=1 Tax=unclassified Methanobacterium TaxID=2627676 RepID=UPI0039C2D80C